jgi:predicted amidohydrolase YtcJ
MNKLKILVLPMVLWLAACSSTEKVDLLVYNAKIYTVDSAFSTAQAMAISDGKIVAVGSQAEIQEKYSSDSLFDAGGKWIYPGFFDAHCHFSYFGLGLQYVDLKETASWEEVLHRLDSFAAIKTEDWIIGRGWDQNDWPDKQLPDRAELDKRFPNRPVYLNRVDGHAVLVNGKALEMAGIEVGQKINGGMIATENGRLTGLLVDNATALVEAVLPQADIERWKQAMRDAQQLCLAAGLTTVAEAGLDCLQITLLQQLELSGELKIGIYPMLTPSAANLNHYLPKGPQRSNRVHVRGVKFYADGALGSRGAYLHQPYHDHPGHNGLLVTPLDTLARLAAKIHRAGYQVNTHCIGDAANALVLGVYQETFGKKRDHRWRIEHAQVVQPADQYKFAALSVIPSVQPTHATSDMYWAEERLGPDRVKFAYPYQDLLTKTGILAFGTDFPVEGIDPLRTFYAAVFRQDSKGWPEGGFLPEQRVSRIDALRAMTIWAAYAQFEDDEKGSLEQGKAADFVVLDTDLMSAGAKDLLQAKVQATYINGEAVYRRKSD